MQVHNRYFGMRHGLSKANMQGMIISDIKNGKNDYGLAKEGIDGVHFSVQNALSTHLLDSKTIILSSDFMRAYETAMIAHDILHTSDIIIAEELRERYFGSLEKSTHALSAYGKIWAQDQIDPTHRTHEVESVTDVSGRVASLIDQLEKDHIDETILLVSHGDTLYILQMYFEAKGSNPSQAIPHFQNSEIRRLG